MTTYMDLWNSGKQKTPAKPKGSPRTYMDLWNEASAPRVTSGQLPLPPPAVHPPSAYEQNVPPWLRYAISVPSRIGSGAGYGLTHTIGPVVDTAANLGTTLGNLAAQADTYVGKHAPPVVAQVAKGALTLPELWAAGAPAVHQAVRAAENLYPKPEGVDPAAATGEVLGVLGGIVPLVAGSEGVIGAGLDRLGMGGLARFVTEKAPESSGIIRQGVQGAARAATQAATVSAEQGQKLPQIASSAELGGVLGGGLGAVAEGDGSLVNRALRIIRKVHEDPGVVHRTTKTLISTLTHSAGLTTEGAKEILAKYGPEATIYDLPVTALRNLVRKAAEYAPDGSAVKTQIEQQLKGRIENLQDPQRVTALVHQVLQGGPEKYEPSAVGAARMISELRRPTKIPEETLHRATEQSLLGENENGQPTPVDPVQETEAALQAVKDKANSVWEEDMLRDRLQLHPGVNTKDKPIPHKLETWLQRPEVQPFLKGAASATRTKYAATFPGKTAPWDMGLKVPYTIDPKTGDVVRDLSKPSVISPATLHRTIQGLSEGIPKEGAPPLRSDVNASTLSMANELRNGLLNPESPLGQGLDLQDSALAKYMQEFRTALENRDAVQKGMADARKLPKNYPPRAVLAARNSFSTPEAQEYYGKGYTTQLAQNALGQTYLKDPAAAVKNFYNAKDLLTAATNNPEAANEFVNLLRQHQDQYIRTLQGLKDITVAHKGGEPPSAVDTLGLVGASLQIGHHVGAYRAAKNYIDRALGGMSPGEAESFLSHMFDTNPENIANTLAPQTEADQTIRQQIMGLAAKTAKTTARAVPAASGVSLGASLSPGMAMPGSPPIPWYNVPGAAGAASAPQIGGAAGNGGQVVPANSGAGMAVPFGNTSAPPPLPPGVIALPKIVATYPSLAALANAAGVGPMQQSQNAPP